MSINNLFAQPGFVTASKVEDVADGLRLFTFPDGFRCYSHSSEQETALIYNEIFVKREYLGTPLSLENCRYVFDVGANIGLFTVFAKLSNPDLVVHAFEPIKATYEVLVKNVELHGLQDVYLHNYALGTQDQSERVLTFYPNAPGNTTAHPEAKEELKHTIGEEITQFLFQSPQTYIVPVRTLSAVLDETGIPTIDLLKIDTENDELAILQGISDAHYRAIRQITGEIHSDALLAEIRQLLASQGFDVVSEVGIVNLHALYAVRQTALS